MTVDPQTRTIFATNTYPQVVGQDLSLFPTSANGNATPYYFTGTPFGAAIGLAINSAGNLIDAHGKQDPFQNRDNIGIDTVQPRYNESKPSLYTIHDFRAFGIAADPSTRTFFASSANGIYRLHENTINTVNDHTLKPAPVSIIDDKCAGPLAVAPGYLPDTYALHPGGTNGCSATPAVYVYYNRADGDVKPCRVLSGPATGLNAPAGIYVGMLHRRNPYEQGL